MGVEQEDAWLPSRWEHGRPRRGCARRGGRVAVTYSQVAENSGLGGMGSCTNMPPPQLDWAMLAVSWLCVGGTV